MKGLLSRWKGANVVRGGTPQEPDVLDRIYRELLGRPIDPSGREVYRRLLDAGGTPLDVALDLVRSQEYIGRILRQNTRIPDIRPERPASYRMAKAASDGREVPVFEVREKADFDWLEGRILGNGYYDIPGIWNLPLNFEKRLCAEMLGHLTQRATLEIGCASGGLLQALDDIGCHAEGIEISRRMIEASAPFVRARIHEGDPLSLSLPGKYDLVVGLDIFEHFNPNRLDDYIAKLSGLLERGGFLFGNIPAIGADSVFGTVCPVYLDEWRDDVVAGQLFRLLEVDETGYPLQGHLIWAPSAWWVARFEAHGLRREVEIERSLHVKYDDVLTTFSPARRAFFVFSLGLSEAERERTLTEIRTKPSAALTALAAGSAF